MAMEIVTFNLNMKCENDAQLPVMIQQLLVQSELWLIV